MLVTKRRRKKDGTVELQITCPLCRGKAEINPSLELWHCWHCNEGGAVPPAWLSAIPSQSLAAGRIIVKRPKVRKGEKLPAYARAEIERRGLNPEWLTERYRVGWDGERLVFPAGEGASRRAVFSWETPKTLTVPPKGLIGQHLLTTGCHVVITEGDYKAACIPLPWIGLGLMGTSISQAQADTVKGARPQEVIIMLDAGYRNEADNVRRALLPLPVRVVFPSEGGPDDITRAELYSLLLGEKQ